MGNNFEELNKKQEPLSHPKQEQDKTAWYFLLVIAFCAFRAWIQGQFKPREKRIRIRTPQKIQKETVREMYKVDKQTLGKWVQHFCDPSVLSYEIYKKRRRLAVEEYDYLISCFGTPTEEIPNRLKGEIADKGDSHTDTLRAWVIQNIDKFGFSVETYDALNVFPPLIAQQISDSFTPNIIRFIPE